MGKKSNVEITLSDNKKINISSDFGGCLLETVKDVLTENKSIVECIDRWEEILVARIFLPILGDGRHVGIGTTPWLEDYETVKVNMMENIVYYGNTQQTFKEIYEETSRKKNKERNTRMILEAD